MKLRATTMFLPLLLGCNLPTIPGGDTETGTGTSAGASSTGTAEPTTSGPGGETSGSETSGGGSLCGNGQIDVGEVCDGAELGGKTCVDVNPEFTEGALACAMDCGDFDLSGCMSAPAEPLVTLNEVTSKGIAEGPHADMGDAIELYNAGRAAADLSGWKLSDDASFPVDKTYVFPPGSTLEAGAFLVLVELNDVTMTGELPFGISGSNEETLTLADAGGVVIDAVTFEGALAEVSYCRVPDGVGAWAACDPTFGATNQALSEGCGDGVVQPGEACDGVDLGGQTCMSLGYDGGMLGCVGCVLDSSGCTTSAVVAVNEVESVDDQIELYNPGDQAVDLSGWILTDDVVDMNYDPLADAEKLEFPAMTSIGPKQFLIVAKGMGPGQHIFGLGAGGDAVSLLRPDLVVVDVLSYGADEALTSYCRLPDGPGGTPTVGCMPTLGAANKGP